MNLLKVKAWAGGDGEAFINLCAAVVFPFVPKLGFTAASDRRLVGEEYLRSPLTLFSKMTTLHVALLSAYPKCRSLSHCGLHWHSSAESSGAAQGQESRFLAHLRMNVSCYLWLIEKSVPTEHIASQLRAGLSHWGCLCCHGNVARSALPH